MKNVLLIVDPQNDFITGSLPVEGAEAKMEALAEYIKVKKSEYDYILFTSDSHGENHCSFKENGGIWPKHCVIFTEGWNIPDYLENAFGDYTRANDYLRNVSCYHKGDVDDREEYSIFDNEEDGYILANHIKYLIKEDEVYFDVCGIAGDYCVLETLKGLRGIVGNNYISVLGEFTASIDGGEKLRTFLNENNINYITDSSLNLTEYVR